jgi:hypothetical protein
LIAAIASAALIVAGSLIAGQGAMLLCGRREFTWLAGPVGLALLLAVSAIVAGLDGRGAVVGLALALLVILAGLALVGGGGKPGDPVRRRLDVHVSRRPRSPAAEPPPGIARFAAPVAAAALAVLFAAIPFIAAGNVGILGVGLVNDDMASHLLLADWIDERFRPEPVLIDQGYPLGPHALVAGLGTLLGASSIDVFAGLTLAIPALTALVAYETLGGLRTAPRIGASALVALPYLAAAYLAQEAFKEPTVAMFLLAFALLLPTVRGWRDAIPLGLLAAGTVYVYSFPGLAWLVGTALAWSALRLVWLARLPRIMIAPRPRIVRPMIRRALPAVGAAALTLVILSIPEFPRLVDFEDFRALDPDRANEGGTGNLSDQISPLEALGIWPTSEFRLSAAASSIPAIVFYAGALLAACALALALPRWLRRHGPAIPLALLTASILYVLARAFGTVYTSAKALAIAAPLITLITLGGLLSRELITSREEAGGQVRESWWERVRHAAVNRIREAAWSGGTRHRLRSRIARTLADMDVKPPVPEAPRARRLPALGLIGTLFALGAAFSSFLILRQAPVGPETHMNELAEIRPHVEGDKLLFLGRDNFVLYSLRGSKPFTHVRNFYDPYFVEPNFELERVGSKFDFDSVTASTLARFPYVLTTRAAYASGPPPGYDPVAETDSYVLWERGGEVDARRPGETDEEPGRLEGCTGSAERVATFSEPPVLWPATDWTATTIEHGDRAEVEIELPPGAWSLSLQYDSTRPLVLTAPGFEAALPGNLDYRGTAPFWAAGTVDVREAGEVTIAASVEAPPLAGRLLGADSVAHLGALAATLAGGNRVGSRCRGYVDWYERR